MNVLTRTAVNIARSFITNYTPANKFHVIGNYGLTGVQGSLVSKMRESLTNTFQAFEQIRFRTTLRKMHKRGAPYKKAKKSKNPFNGQPFAKGVILKTVIKKPKKPNSANRKCVIVKLSTGKEMTAYVPGIGHNLQEHNMVLCRVGRLQDTPGVKIKCVRGKYDLPHVKKN